MQVYQCLEKGAKTSGRVFLTASAGTGKTFAIEHIVLRKILEGIEIDEILVVTFTREATRSLRRRIYLNLVQVLEILTTNISIQEHGLYYLEAIDVDQAKKFASRALYNLDQAQIFTIHGFCLEMLKKHSLKESLILSNVGLDGVVETEQKVVQEIFMLFRNAASLDFCLSQKSLFIEQTNKDMHKLVQILKPLLFGAVAIKETRSFCQIKESFVKSDLQIDALLEDLEELKKHFKGLCSQSGEIHKGFIDQMRALQEDRLDDLIGEKNSLFSLLGEKNKKKSYALCRQDLHYYSLFFEQGPKIESLIQEACNIDNLNHRFCFLMKKHFDVKGDLFFADKLLQKMSCAIDEPSFCKRVQESYKAVIVDEFQDTDDLQYSIFKRLFFDQQEIFFCVVGDEKQSIYAFRGADLDTFERAKQDFLAEQFKLDSNYRSSKGIIDGLELLLKDFARLDDEDIAFNFQKVHSRSKGVDYLEPSLEFFLQEKKKEDNPLYSAMYNRIQELKKEHSLKDSSFAFLVKDRFQAAKLYTFLKEQGASVDALIKESLFDSPAFFWIMLLLDLLDQRSRCIKKALLLHPLIGHSSALFQEGQESSVLHIAFGALDSIIEVFDEKGLSAAFSCALEAPVFYEGVSLQESLVARDKLQAFFALKKVIQLVLFVNLEKALSIKDLIVELKKMIRENREDIASLQDVTSSKNSMVIMTSHASKGLEFDVVIPVGLMLETKSKKDVLQQEAIEIDREKMRLFYVAMTRAKRKLLIPCTFSNKASNIGYARASCMDLFFARKAGPCSYQELYERVQELSEGRIRQALEGFYIHCQSDAKKSAIKPPSPFLQKPKSFSALLNETKVHSFSSLYKQQRALHFESLCDDIEGGRLFGTLMHKILELCVSKGFHHPFHEKNIQDLIKRYLKFTPLKKDFSRIFEMVKNTFFKPIQEGLCLADIPKKQIHLEEEFIMHSRDNLDLKGFVDLVFIHNTSLYIIDYKTHHLPNYKEEMIQKVVEYYQYDKQLVLYKQACSRYIKTHKLAIDKINTYLIFLRGCICWKGE